jgi:hypothetical protein
MSGMTALQSIHRGRPGGRPASQGRQNAPRPSSIQLSPITEHDLDDVGAFLHSHLNPRLSAHDWSASMTPAWSVEAPNRGFLLRDGSVVVGAYLAFYSERTIAGQLERFCNLGAWCVLETHRSHGVRLLRAMLGQKGYHFTDFSPSGSVVPLNRRLKFVDLDTSTVLVPNLPWPLGARGVRLVSDDHEIESLLTGEDLRRYHDHRAAAAARQFVLKDEHGRLCHVVVRKDRRRKVPLFASILHVGDPEVFARHQGIVYRHLLLRHGAAATLVEPRVTGRAPRRGRRLASARPKMFRSSSLKAEDIDYLYSELTCVAW